MSENDEARYVWADADFAYPLTSGRGVALAAAATKVRRVTGPTLDELDEAADAMAALVAKYVGRVAGHAARRLGGVVTAAVEPLHTFHLPGQHNQSTHGHGGATGQAALDATPAKLTPAPEGHFGKYEGEKLEGPGGMGSVRALSEYEGVEYQTTNSYLRHGPMAESPNMAGHVTERVRQHDAETAARIEQIDKTMAASRLTSDVQVERVVQHGGTVFGSAYHNADMNSDDLVRQDAGYERWQRGERPNLTGLRFRDKGYTSTTADPAVAERFGERWARFAKENPGQIDGEPVIMKIQVPKGTGAIQLSPMFSGRKGDPGEAELLLDRGLTFEVTGDHGVGDDGYRRLDVSVVPG